MKGVNNKLLSSEQLLKQYSIRVSGRAKYMRLTISLDKGIVVVVPKSMSQRRMAKLIPQFVKDKQDWLSEAIEKLQARGQIIPDIEQCQLPEKITLIALGVVFSITYDSLSKTKDSLSSTEGFLYGAEGFLSGAEGSLSKAEGSLTLHHLDEYKLAIRGRGNRKQVFQLLEKFFKDYARYYLQQRLDQLSKEFTLPYKGLTVRAQKTRWGSCSSKKNINLNYRLLFIEKKLLDYILLHELVHTVHMNHSRAFWLYFESLMPDARSRDRQVNRVAKSLPCWIFHK